MKYISSSSYLGRGGRRRSAAPTPVPVVVVVVAAAAAAAAVDTEVADEEMDARDAVVGALTLELLETES